MSGIDVSLEPERGFGRGVRLPISRLQNRAHVWEGRWVWGVPRHPTTRPDPRGPTPVGLDNSNAPALAALVRGNPRLHGLQVEGNSLTELGLLQIAEVSEHTVPSGPAPRSSVPTTHCLSSPAGHRGPPVPL